MSVKTLRERIKNITIKTLLITLGSYVGFGSISHGISEFKYPKLQDESKIEEIFRRETKKLNLEDKKIDLKLVDYSLPLFPAGVKILNEGGYLVVLMKDAINEGSIKHELYHIYKGDKGGVLSPKFRFVEEPRAILYEVYDIKL